MHKHERPEPEARGAVDGPQNHPTAPAPVESVRADAANLPEGVKSLAAVMQEVADVLPGLKRALENCAGAKPPVERLANRLDEVADSLGMSRRAIERERSAGRFPAPDLHIGKAPLWRPETIRDWLDSKKRGRR